VTEIAPYGSWASPITPTMLAGGGVDPEFPVADGDDVLWLESRPAEDGRSVLVRRSADGTIADLAEVRTLVHEYGGRAHAVRGGVLVASLAADQRVWRLDGPEPVPLTPEPPAPLAWRYADHELSPDGRWVLCVRERHAAGAEAVTDLVAIPLSGGGDAVVLADGRDFFLAPRLSPDGRRLAWLAWDHPDMAWDAAELWVADVEPVAMAVSGARRVAGGDGVAAGQPRWSPEG
jgi:WD40-like Beta Propeller Repeat